LGILVSKECFIEKTLVRTCSKNQKVRAIELEN
jgi:hypothetical protein